MNQTEPKQPSPAKMIYLMLMVAGVVYLLAALVFNDWIIGRIRAPLSIEITRKIRSSTLVFFFLAEGFLISAWGLNRLRNFKRFINKPLLANLTLIFLALFLPLSLLEFTLRPFAELGKKTTIFERDNQLGWRLRPGADDDWNGIRVQINNKGLRGPEIDYVKPNHVKRILYLGDSVTFGFLIKSATQTFPYLAEPLLEKALHCEVETINAGVGGYSPWQELEQLRSEGLKYQPDLVIVGFVLNDITTKIQLTRFGGTNEGFQLEHSAQGWLGRWSDRMAILHFGNKLITRLRFGDQVQKRAAEIELINIKTLVNEPERPEYQAAWATTLDNLDKIFTLCKANQIPAALVIFPYRFQYNDPIHLADPQKRLIEFASENNIPVYDIMPDLLESMKAAGVKRRHIYFDWNHFTESGHALIAPLIADYILKENLLSHP